MTPSDQITIRDYCCATCWGHLTVRRTADGETRIECGKYGAEHQGFVTKAYAERRRAESAAEAAEVKELLRGLGVIDNPNAGKTADDILRDLGF
jgi:hypothetical protein